MRALLAALLGQAGVAVAGPLPIDLTGIGFVTYGDGQSFSLPIANIQVGEPPNNPGSTYFFSGQPGQVQDFPIIAIGSSGVGVVQNFSGMDNSYETPSGVSGDTFFQTEAATARGTLGTVNNNLDDTWDSSLLAMKTFLTLAGTTYSPAFLFRNNQANNQGAAAQSLAAWAQLFITDDANNLIDLDLDTPGNQFFLDFTNVVGEYDLVSEGGGGVFMGSPDAYTNLSAVRTDPIAGTQAATDYVLSGGALCIDTDTAIPTPVSCTSPQADEGPINHNLGANQAAYALIAPELNAVLANLFAALPDTTLDDYTFHLDLRLGCDPSLDDTAQVCTGDNGPPLLHARNLSNGDELLYMVPALFQAQVPEPGVLALLGIGLMGMGAVYRRRG